MDRKTMDLLKMKADTSEMSITSCTEAPLSVVGEVRIEVQIADRRHMQRFVVVEQLTHSIILGADLIVAMGIVPLLHTGEYCFGDELAKRYPFNKTSTASSVSVVSTITTGAAREVEMDESMTEDDIDLSTEGDNESPMKNGVSLLTEIEEAAIQNQITELNDQMKSLGLKESELPNHVKVVELPEDVNVVVDLTANAKVVVAGVSVVELTEDEIVIESPVQVVELLINDEEEEKVNEQI